MRARYIDEVVPYTVSKIIPTVHNYDDITDWDTILPEPGKSDLAYIKKGKKSYHLVTYHCGFDTEFNTNSVYNGNKIQSAYAYMYVWQIAINNNVIIGRTWDQFTDLLQIIQQKLQLNATRKLRIWVANLGCEFQFVRKRLHIKSLFARKQREPIYVETTEGIILQDCLMLSGGNLASLAKDYCKTPKMVGDLDYSVSRNNLTPLTDEEMQYIINDVVILAEFDEYMVETYLKQGFDIPLTKTGLLRNSCRKRFQEAFKVGKYINRGALDQFVRCFPRTYRDYNILMQQVYRGGYTHSNIIHTGIELHGVNGVDFTSSYPAVMLQCSYPVTEFTAAACPDTNYLETHFKSCAWYACFRFTGIKRTTPHSIESISKTMEYDMCNGNQRRMRNDFNYLIDNGRVASADQMTVWLTDLDWQTYKKYYTWDNVQITGLNWAVYGPLPSYVTEPLMNAYTAKANLKRQHLDKTPAYAIAKGLLNSGYGMMCQKLNLDEIVYDNDHWSMASTDTMLRAEQYYEALGVDFINDRIITRAKNPIPRVFLLPQWGVWVCAHARKRLLDMVYTIGDDVVYCDTDSIYMLNFDQHTPAINAWNDRIHAWNAANLPPIFDTLGDFDKLADTDYDRFKTLGAKRYLKSHGNDTEVTIAGLPKGVLSAAAEAAGVEIYDFFSDDMAVNIEYSCKHAHKYNDEPHADYITDSYGNTVYMQEQSSLGIYATSFTMSLDEYYAAMISFAISETERKEF